MYYMDREGHRTKKTTSQDKFLKFVYTHTATRVLMRPFLLPAVSRLGGKLLNTKVSAVFAGLFARTHGIDLNKYEKQKFDSYNDFFTRKIKAEERPVNKEDTVLIIGAGPTGICTLLSVMLKNPAKIIICEKDETRIRFINEHYPEILTVSPEDCKEFVKTNSEHGGADAVLEVAGAESTFKLAWECARPNAIVAVVALYDKAQMLPLPDMYGKNLTFKTGGVDGCDCEEILKLISEGKINTEPLITHTYPLNRIEEAYELFENKRDGVIKVAVEC